MNIVARDLQRSHRSVALVMFFFFFKYVNIYFMQERKKRQLNRNVQMFYNYFFSICHLCSTCVHTAQHVKLGVRRDQSVFTGLISVFSFHV